MFEDVQNSSDDTALLQERRSLLSSRARGDELMIPPSCTPESVAIECPTTATCWGGEGPQPCSTCQSIECNNNYCSCNGYTMCWDSDQCKPSSICHGGNGPQN